MASNRLFFALLPDIPPLLTAHGHSPPKWRPAAANRPRHTTAITKQAGGSGQKPRRGSSAG